MITASSYSSYLRSCTDATRRDVVSNAMCACWARSSSVTEPACCSTLAQQKQSPRVLRQRCRTLSAGNPSARGPPSHKSSRVLTVTRHLLSSLAAIEIDYSQPFPHSEGLRSPPRDVEYVPELHHHTWVGVDASVLLLAPRTKTPLPRRTPRTYRQICCLKLICESSASNLV
jgi:hypothetical protein